MSESDRTPDMFDDCRRRADIDREMRLAVERQNEAMREIKVLRAEREAIDARIAARMKAAGCIDAAVEVDFGRSMLTLGARGEVQIRRVVSPNSRIFAEPSPTPVVADAASDAPTADDDIREAAMSFDPASLADIDDEDIRDGIFQAAVDDEVGAESREVMLSLSMAGGN